MHGVSAFLLPRHHSGTNTALVLVVPHSWTEPQDEKEKKNELRLKCIETSYLLPNPASNLTLPTLPNAVVQTPNPIPLQAQDPIPIAIPGRLKVLHFHCISHTSKTPGLLPPNTQQSRHTCFHVLPAYILPVAETVGQLLAQRHSTPLTLHFFVSGLVVCLARGFGRCRSRRGLGWASGFGMKTPDRQSGYPALPSLRGLLQQSNHPFASHPFPLPQPL